MARVLYRAALGLTLLLPGLALAQERSARLLPAAEEQDEDRPTPPVTRWDIAAFAGVAAFDIGTDATAVAYLNPSSRCLGCSGAGVGYLYVALLFAGVRPFLDALIAYVVNGFNEEYAPSYFGGMRGAFAGMGIASAILVVTALLNASTPVVIMGLVLAGLVQPVMTAWFASRNKVPRHVGTEPAPPSADPMPGVPILSL